ncbi:hypothetical protein [Micromonospora sp. NBC_00421]|uniref:hypothetical protein n=1 Tax=Micromonospora sp. NBC_00421 TaxID=2975976 RepID=UPI002E2459B4
MPLTGETRTNTTKLTLTIADADAAETTIDVPTPVPAELGITDDEIQAFYGKVLAAFEASPDLTLTRAELVGEQRLTVTLDEASA